MTEEQYADLESGNTFLKFEIAQKLDSLYKNDTPYCYIFGLQNELLETQKKVFDLLTDKIPDMPDEVETSPDNSDCNYDGSEVDGIKGESTSLDEQDDEPILLLDLVAQDATLVIMTIFKKWGLDAIHDGLWNWLEAAICNNFEPQVLTLSLKIYTVPAQVLAEIKMGPSDLISKSPIWYPRWELNPTKKPSLS